MTRSVGFKSFKALNYLLLVCGALSLTACLVTSTAKNYELGTVSMPVYSYSGTAFLTSPVFGFVLSGTSTPFALVDDTIDVSAFSDSTCSTAATGTFSPSSSTLATSAGQGAMSGSYTWPVANYEGNLYFKIYARNKRFTACSSALPIVRHFNAGYGAVHFGNPGFSGGNQDVGLSVAQDSAGRYIVGGYSANGGGAQRAVLWRYLPDGTPDTTFGASANGGVSFGTGALAGASGAVGAAFVTDAIAQVVIDSSGKYVGVGYSRKAGGGYAAAVYRYDPVLNAWDTSLPGGTGAAISPVPGPAGVGGAAQFDKGKTIQIDSNGSYVIAGTGYDGSGYPLALWRYNPTTGTWELSVSGSTTGAAGGSGAGLTDVPNDLKIDSSGRYVMVGTSKDTNGGVSMAAWRYLSTGVLDSGASGFNSTGYYAFGSPGVAGGVSGVNLNDSANGLAIDSQGRLVIGGSSGNSSSRLQMVIWRLTASGALDTTFKNTGYLTFGAPGVAGASLANQVDTGNAIAIDSSGRYVVVGKSRDASNMRQFVAYRYTSAGVLDTSFNSVGYVYTTSTVAGLATASADDSANRFIIDNFGRIVASGYSLNTGGFPEMAMWRVRSTGAMDQ